MELFQYYYQYGPVNANMFASNPFFGRSQPMKVVLDSDTRPSAAELAESRMLCQMMVKNLRWWSEITEVDPRALSNVYILAINPKLRGLIRQKK